MTDLITLAKQSGADINTYTNRHYPDRTTLSFESESLQAFADLVAHKEREALAKVNQLSQSIDAQLKNYNDNQQFPLNLVALAEKAIKERTS